MSSVAVGSRQYLVTLEAMTAIANTDGGFDEVWSPLTPPTRRAKIQPASAHDLERVAPGTVMASEALLITIPFHPLVTTKTRVSWTDLAGRAHTANVNGVNNPDERCRELILTAVEVVP